MNESDMNENERRVALVTGGSRGIGRAIVEELSGSGYHVAFTYRSGEKEAADLTRSLSEQGISVLSVPADVRDYERAGEVVKEVGSRFGPIDLLVNNAGIKRDAALFRMKPEDWQEVIDTNLGGMFNYSQTVIYGMIKRGSGAIINIGSVSAKMGLPGQTNYAASKAGMIGFTRSLSKEVARFNIRVNAVAPGFIQTEMLDDLPEKARKKMSAQIPMGSPGSPGDVAQAVVFLAGEGSHYITGQVLQVDGGIA